MEHAVQNIIAYPHDVLFLIYKNIQHTVYDVDSLYIAVYVFL